jgi:hypothetical protein
MFSFHKLSNSYPIAKTNKNRTVYFVPEVAPDIEAYQDEVIKNGKLESVKEIRELLTGNVLMSSVTLAKGEEFFPLPVVHNKKRVAISIIGNSGSGKSVFTSNFIKKYHKLLPDNELFLLSNKNQGDEPAFEDIEDLKYIPINSLNEPVNVKNFKNCLFVFDDIHEGVILDPESEFVKSIEKEKLSVQQKIIKDRQKQLDSVIDRSSINILSLGRSREISTVIVKHSFRDGKSNLYKTEGTDLVVFPAGNTPKIKEYYKNIEGLSKSQIDRLFSLKESKETFQFIYLSRQGLRYAISNRNIISLDLEE